MKAYMPMVERRGQGVHSPQMYEIEGGHWVPAEVARRLESALRDCADDLEAEVKGKYHGSDMSLPYTKRNYDADMSCVVEANAALDMARGDES